MNVGPEQPPRPGAVSRGASDGSGDGASGTGWVPDPGLPYAPGQVPGPPVAPRTPPGDAPAWAESVATPVTQAVGGPRPAPAPAAVTDRTRPITVGPAMRKGGRRARLTVKRIDPWSVLKFSFVYSLAGLVVLLVAVIALYAIVDAMGVIDSIRSFLHDVEGQSSGGGIASWLGFGRVMTVALVVGSVNVILFTAFATLSAFVYNVCTDLVGGIEVTLADRS